MNYGHNKTVHKSTLADHLGKLPNGFAINQHFHRYLRTEFLFGAGIFINIALTVLYVTILTIILDRNEHKLGPIERLVS